MYNFSLHQRINDACSHNKLDAGGKDQAFHTRFIANTSAIRDLYTTLYGYHANGEQYFDELIQTIIKAYTQRHADLQLKDAEKEKKITGSSVMILPE